MEPNLTLYACLLGAALIAGFIAYKRWRFVRYKTEMINRRDCMFFLENWPDAKGNDLQLDERFNGLYQVLGGREVESAAEDYLQLLKDFGNKSVDDSVSESVQLPVEYIHCKVGVRRMETRDQYIKHCEAEITAVNNAYHLLQSMAEDGKNYKHDYIMKRPQFA